MRFAATGAAAIDPEALEFVLGLGLPVLRGVGHVGDVVLRRPINPPDAVRIGTVGKPLAGVELRLADDGELLVRGPLLMKGYRNEPEKTAEAIDADGWLHTGDIATIDADGYVTIVDRKKELMINAAGKNMSPANIEGAVKAHCPLVGSAVAIGDDRPYVVALLTLDPDAVRRVRQRRTASPTRPPQALADDPQVRAADRRRGARRRTRGLSRVEQIKKYTILPDVWEPGGDEITPTMKLKRKPIAAKYARRDRRPVRHVSPASGRAGTVDTGPVTETAMPEEEPGTQAHPAVHGAGLIGLAVGALGVVFGDIGTSPLYALQTVFAIDNHAVQATTATSTA